MHQIGANRLMQATFNNAAEARRSVAIFCGAASASGRNAGANMPGASKPKHLLDSSASEPGTTDNGMPSQ